MRSHTQECTIEGSCEITFVSSLCRVNVLKINAFSFLSLFFFIVFFHITRESTPQGGIISDSWKITVILDPPPFSAYKYVYHHAHFNIQNVLFLSCHKWRNIQQLKVRKTLYKHRLVNALFKKFFFF